MPRHQRFPHARPPRRTHARHVLIGVVMAAGVLIVTPSLGPRGAVLDLRGAGAGPAAVAQGPTPTRWPSPGETRAPGDAAATSAPTLATTPAPPRPVLPRAGGRIDLGVEAPTPWIRPLATGPTPVSALTGYAWPLAHPRLTLPFGPTPWGSRLVDGQPFHDGVDLATFCGDRIRAAHAGTVIAAGRHYDAAMGWVGSLGPYLARLDGKHLWSELPIVIVIDDGNGYRSIYAHFGRIVVGKGDAVEAGDLLGFEGMTGRASGCHLHYGLFSPLETATFRMEPGVVRRMKVPKAQTARVDPLLVLPPRAGINAPKRDGAETSP